MADRLRPCLAQHWISGLRDHAITLACLRLGQPTAYAKGAHRLPGGLAAALETALVRALSEAELRRALAAAIGVVASELQHCDPPLAARLQPMLTELRGPGTASGASR